MTSPQIYGSSERRVRSSLSLPTRMDYLEPLQNYVAGVFRVHGCDEESGMVSLALEEAVSNVIRHGYPSDEEGSFEVSFEIGPAGVSLEIHEKGLPFDPEKLESYGDATGPDDSGAGGGIGIRLMKGAMDSVKFLNLGKEGKMVRMYKHFRHARVDRFFSSQELSRQEAPPEASAGPCEIRPLRVEDALEVSRCAYRAYGYTYREFIYYPGRIWELNEDGHLRSFIAVDRDQQIVGHLALSFSEPGAKIAEMAAAFVNPSCRGQGLLGRLDERVMSEAREMGLEALFVHAVTSHPASQKAARRAGFVPSGLLLAALFADLEFKALTGRVGQKESALLMVKPLGKRSRYGIWVPGRYAETIRSLAGEMGREVAVSGEGASLCHVSGGEGNSYHHVEEFNFAEIRIVTYGEDVLAELRHRLGRFERAGVDVSYLYLHAECPEAVTFADRCRNLGFFFCGYMPGEMGGRDALILQKLNKVAVDFSVLALAEDRSLDLMKFIEQDMALMEEV